MESMVNMQARASTLESYNKYEPHCAEFIHFRLSLDGSRAMLTILSPTYKRDFPYKRKHSQLKCLKEFDLQYIVYIPGIL